MSCKRLHHEYSHSAVSNPTIKVDNEDQITSLGNGCYLRWPGMGALGAVYPLAPLVIGGRVGKKDPPGMGRTGAAYDGTGKS